MALEALLVELLVCPEDKQPLWYLEGEAVLYNPRLRRRYPVREGIPVLLVSESEPVDDAGHAQLAALFEAGGVLTGAGPAAAGGEPPAAPAG